MDDERRCARIFRYLLQKLRTIWDCCFEFLINMTVMLCLCGVVLCAIIFFPLWISLIYNLLMSLGVLTVWRIIVNGDLRWGRQPGIETPRDREMDENLETGNGIDSDTEEEPDAPTCCTQTDTQPPQLEDPPSALSERQIQCSSSRESADVSGPAPQDSFVGHLARHRTAEYSCPAPSSALSRRGNSSERGLGYLNESQLPEDVPRNVTDAGSRRSSVSSDETKEKCGVGENQTKDKSA